eukprot:GHVS01026534.1.p1 GENE.GHVS01026534.1~~GHVS01026534.1.p1  ORF type:complete len:385 (+),score=36.75 GHVS01026534.1:205-1359(+)
MPEIPARPVCGGSMAAQGVEGMVALQLREWVRSMGYRPKQEGSNVWYKHRILTGGITNQLLRVSLDRMQLEKDPASPPSAPDVLQLPDQQLSPLHVVVRLFGDKTDLIVDRARVKLIEDFLEQSEIAKAVYWRFPEGQVEEWLSGRSMDEQDMRKHAQHIASHLARLHIFPSTRLAHSRQLPFCLEGTSVLWESTEKFLSACMDAVEGKALHQRLQDCGALSLMDLTPLKDMLRKVQEMCDCQRSPLVLGHGDLLSGNIVILDNGAIRFIDLEYSGLMERGFDIANHFCEYAGFDCDFASLFPTEEEQRDFLRCYRDTAQLSETTVDELLSEIQPFVLASHLLWGTFGLFQSINSKIDFDFFSYGVRRLSALFDGENLKKFGRA